MVRWQGCKSSYDFIKTDFARIAQAFDCRGISVTKAEELGPVLKKALRTSVSTVIDVVISSSEPHSKITAAL